MPSDQLFCRDRFRKELCTFAPWEVCRNFCNDAVLVSLLRGTVEQVRNYSQKWPLIEEISAHNWESSYLQDAASFVSPTIKL